MGIDVGGAFKISGASGSQAFNITELAGSKSLFNIDTTGRTTMPNQIGFIAYRNADPGTWTSFGPTWQKITEYNAVSYNQGSGFSISTSKFTAPVTGLYRFHCSAYIQKTSAYGNYYYMGFGVNGTGNIPNSIKIRGYFQTTGLLTDGDMCDLIYLSAGDTVEHDCFGAIAASFQYYPYYLMFSGFLMS